MPFLKTLSKLNNGAYMRDYEPDAPRPPKEPRNKQSQQALARARRSPDYVAPPTEDTLGLALRSEELALNLPQRVQRGDDLGRFMRKKGVTQQEIEALKLDELFKRDRVTQQELVDHIDQNRVRLEVTEYTGGKDADVDFGYESLSAEEAYGPDYLEQEAKELIEYGGLFLGHKLEAMDWVPVEVRNDKNAAASWESFQDGILTFDELPSDLKAALEDEAYQVAVESYAENPIQRITLRTDRDETDYTLVGNEDTGFSVAANEPTGSPMLNHATSHEPVYSESEAEVLLQSLAESDGFIGLNGGTRWSEHTVDPYDLDGYRERLLQLNVPENRFSYNHYSDPNVLASPRTSDKVGPNGEKILYVEEIQSDYAQQGRDRGFKDQGVLDDANQALDDFSKEVASFGATRNTADVTTTEPAWVFRNIGDGLNDLNNADPKRRIAGQHQLKHSIRALKVRVGNNTDKLVSEFIMDNPDFLGDLPRTKLEEIARVRLEAEGERDVDRIISAMQTSELKREVALELRGDGIGIKGKQAEEARRKKLESVFPEGAELSRRMQDQSIDEIERYLVDSRGYQAGIVPKLFDAEEKYGKRLDQFEEQELAYEPSPFVTNSEDWNKLVAKDLILEADRGGYDQIAFAPSEAHIDRWNEKGLKQQYDVNVPSAFRKAGGVAPQRRGYLVESDRGEQYDSPVIDLRQKGPDGLTPAEKVKRDNTLFTPAATTLGAGYLGAQAVPGFNEKASAVGEVAAAGLTSLAAPFLTGPSSFLESMNPAVPVDELERRRAARQDRVTSKIESPLAQAYAEQAQQAVAPILQDINQNPYLNALPFDELYDYGSKAVKELPARLRFMGGALLDSTGL